MEETRKPVDVRGETCEASAVAKELGGQGKVSESKEAPPAETLTVVGHHGVALLVLLGGAQVVLDCFELGRCRHGIRERPTELENADGFLFLILLLLLFLLLAAVASPQLLAALPRVDPIRSGLRLDVTRSSSSSSSSSVAFKFKLKLPTYPNNRSVRCVFHRYEI